MDWLILFLLVPVSLVPVIMLGGFAGCYPAATSCFGDEDCPGGTICEGDGTCIEVPDPDVPVPSAPDNLSANAVSESEIDLSWNNTDLLNALDHFQIERHEDGGRFAPILDPATGAPLEVTAEIFVDLDVIEGITFFYRVRGCNIEDVCSTQPSDSASATVLPAAPSNLIATPVDVDTINLQWINNSSVASQFSIEERPNAAATFTEFFRGAATAGAISFSHTGLVEGSTHEYQVFVIVANGTQNSIGPRDIKSSPSPPAAATTLAFAPAFAVLPSTDTNQPNVGAFCIVQLIPAALLSRGGTRARITLRGTNSTQPGSGSLTLDRIFISQVDAVAAAPDPYDAAADLTLVAANVSLAVDSVVTLPPVSYTLDNTKDLLIAFDVSAIPGQNNLRFSPQPGTGLTSFARAVTAEAGIADRTSGYTPAPDNVYLIERIEVL